MQAVALEVKVNGWHFLELAAVAVQAIATPASSVRRRIFDRWCQHGLQTFDVGAQKIP
jgi:hypothetical protein